MLAEAIELQKPGQIRTSVRASDWIFLTTCPAKPGDETALRAFFFLGHR
jgi:hypothetical protein